MRLMPGHRHRTASGLAATEFPPQAQHCQNPPTENSDNVGETIMESWLLGLIRAEVDDDDDGVHGGRMKPLSSFNANKSIKKLARMPNAVKGKQSSLMVSKENTHVEAKNTSTVPRKEIKQNRSSAGEGSDRDFGKFPKRRETSIGTSPYHVGSNATKCEEECVLPPFVELSMPLSTNGMEATSDSEKLQFEKTCPSASFSKSEQFTSWDANALLNQPSSQEAVVSSGFILGGVSSLPMFKNFGFIESSEETLANSKCAGLYILGAAACLSLGPDKSPHGPSKQSVCTAHCFNSSKDVDKLQAANSGANKSCPSPLREMPLDTISKCSLNLGADFSLGLSQQSTEDSLDSSLNENGDDGMQEVIQSEVENQGTTYPLLQKLHALKGRENLENLEKDGLRTMCGMLRNPCQEAVQSNMYKNIPQETVRDYRCFSNISVPLERILLVPKVWRHARRLPAHLKRRKCEILKQKTNIGKKEQIRKFLNSAAPSGLLADLNPGIINHVRNSKQVHAIIEAVVGSATLSALQGQKEKQREVEDELKDIVGKNSLQGKMCENGDSSGNIYNSQNDSSMFHASKDMLDEYEHINDEFNKRKTERPSAMNVCSSGPIMVDCAERDIDASLLGEGFESTAASSSFCTCTGCSSGGFCLEQMACKHDFQKAKNYGCHANGKLDTQSTCSASATLKATGVASIWFGLLNQDIKGRLSALRRSRKRVRAIMRDNLACNSIEHSISIGDKDEQQVLQASNVSQNVNVLVNVEPDIHIDNWRSLFYQMDKSLQVEGMQLECWLSQVKEMQAQYLWGVENFQRCISNSHDM